MYVCTVTAPSDLRALIVIVMGHDVAVGHRIEDGIARVQTVHDVLCVGALRSGEDVLCTEQAQELESHPSPRPQCGPRVGLAICIRKIVVDLVEVSFGRHTACCGYASFDRRNGRQQRVVQVPYKAA